MSELDTIEQLFRSFWSVIGGAIVPDDARSVLTAIGFFNGFLTYILTTIVARKAYIRIQRGAIIVLAAQWGSLLTGSLGVLTHVEIFGIQFFLFKVALMVWIGSLSLLFLVIRQIIYVDRVRFKKPGRRSTPKEWVKARHGTSRPLFKEFRLLRSTVEDKNSSGNFGVSCIDHYLEKAARGEPPPRLFFPILL